MKSIYWITLVGSGLAIAACQKDEPRPRTADPTQTGLNNEPNVMGMDNSEPTNREDLVETARASADIEGADGTEIEGEMELSEEPGRGVRIQVSVENAPVGSKGLHIHEKGDCSDIPGKSMGGHFAPQGHQHGLPDQSGASVHLGDLGNIEIQNDGTGKKEITIAAATLKEGDPMSLLGKAVVIHESNDKGASEQPSGASGNPVACGVIEKD